MKVLSTASSTLAAAPRGLRLHVADNVIVALDEIVPGPVNLIGASESCTLVATQGVASGHKLAVRSIRSGTQVIKCGVVIGLATDTIEPGEWVHLHNCRSAVDERSGTADVHSGAATDIAYL